MLVGHGTDHPANASYAALAHYFTPVSYTHLDVYKRQVRTPAAWKDRRKNCKRDSLSAYLQSITPIFPKGKNVCKLLYCFNLLKSRITDTILRFFEGNSFRKFMKGERERLSRAEKPSVLPLTCGRTAEKTECSSVRRSAFPQGKTSA